MKSLKSKTALVTGGARGIGKAITKQLLKDGASVLICSRKKEELENTCKELDPSGKKLFYFVADVSDFNQCKKLFVYAKKIFNKIDILVNNAGIYGPIGLLEENPAEEWLHTIQVNLLGTVHCTKLILPLMKRQDQGKIINVAGAGIGGSKPLSRASAYYTSKAGVAAFTEVIATEVIENNIQVNCISPGAINTFFVDYLLAQDPKKAGPMYEEALNLKRTGGGSLQSVMALVSFLASDESNNVTGKILSAKWDKIETLKELTPKNKNKFVLRRIDEDLFSERK
jgi:3-oxoacyl-[acyl-carrier protein] reductase